MERVVRSEILDRLSFDHPAALRNRRELQGINFVMGNHRAITRAALRVVRPGDRLLEIGAGSGELGRRLRRNATLRSNLSTVDGLDRCPAPKGCDEGRWWQEDAVTFPGYPDYHVVVANLLLHQFTDEQLAGLGTRLDLGTRAIIAVEPVRRRLHLRQWRLLSLLGLGRVSRHDGRVSIEAGFLGDELPELLGLSAERWLWRRETNWRGQYFLVAQRIDSSDGA